MQRQAKEAQQQDDAAQVSRFENYVAILVKVHQDCGADWNWHNVAQAAPPTEPVHSNRYEAAARNGLDAYKPGFFERLFGEANSKRASLERALHDGKQADQDQYMAAMVEFRQMTVDWQTEVRLAPGVLKRDIHACREALTHVGAFDELSTFKTEVAAEAINGDVIRLRCLIMDPEIVPREELKLTSGGKLSTKDMAIGRYWSLFQDHVCSTAIRVARETFAVLPVSRVIVNVAVVRLDTSTGHTGPVTILGVSFAREDLSRLNLKAIDPSDSMRNLPHRMKFKKTSGFDGVEPMTEEEQWIST